MSATMSSTPEELQAELCTLTDMNAAEWDDFFCLTPAQQVQVAENYRGLSWAQSSDTFGKVIAVLGVLATIAGAVSGIASAASAVAALKTI